MRTRSLGAKFRCQTFARSISNKAVKLILGSFPLLERSIGAPRFSDYPFSLGVASGDPLPDGVVLWTRLAQSRWQRMDVGVCPEIVFPCGGRWPPMKLLGGLCAKARHVRRPSWPTLCT